MMFLTLFMFLILSVMAIYYVLDSVNDPKSFYFLKLFIPAYLLNYTQFFKLCMLKYFFTTFLNVTLQSPFPRVPPCYPTPPPP